MKPLQRFVAVACLSLPLVSLAQIDSIYYPDQGKVVIPRLQLGDALYYVMLENVGGLTFVVQESSIRDLSVPAGFVPAEPEALIGTWSVDDVEFTFEADGTYSLDHGPSTDPNCNPLGGAESGTYQYDADTGVLTTVATSDANRECGLSHPNFGPLRMKTAGANLVMVTENGEEVVLTRRN